MKVFLAALAAQAQLAMPDIIAHRGASHDAPENTLAAYKLAWEQDADGIEGDYRLSRDGKIVVSHDTNTARMGDKNLVVAQSTFEELRQVDVGRKKGAAWKGERIPTIEEVLAVVPTGKKIYIEIYEAREVPLVKEALAQSKLRPEQVTVISFTESAVAAAKKEISGIKTLWIKAPKKNKRTGELQPTVEQLLATLKKVNADGIDCSASEAVDKAFVSQFQKAGFEFHVWTVDKAEEAKRLAGYGVKSITTNRPKFIREQLEALLKPEKK
jgi:glycerophosphoryl diester phosphodiesterase